MKAILVQVAIGVATSLLVVFVLDAIKEERRVEPLPRPPAEGQ